MCVYIYIYIYIYIYVHRDRCPEDHPKLRAPVGIHYRGVQWEGGAVDWGSII